MNMPLKARPYLNWNCALALHQRTHVSDIARISYSGPKDVSPPQRSKMLSLRTRKDSAAAVRFSGIHDSWSCLLQKRTLLYAHSVGGGGLGRMRLGKTENGEQYQEREVLSDVGFRQSEFSLLKTPVMFVCCRTSDPEIRELDRAFNSLQSWSIYYDRTSKSKRRQSHTREAVCISSYCEMGIH